MTDYNKIGFKNKVVDKLVKNDSLPKPTFKRFNVPLYTGVNPGTKQDSLKYTQGFSQGIKNFQRGLPNAFGLRDSDNFYRAGRRDGVEAMKKSKNTNNAKKSKKK